MTESVADINEANGNGGVSCPGGMILGSDGFGRLSIMCLRPSLQRRLG